jgi:two-component system cell cycle response regulator
VSLRARLALALALVVSVPIGASAFVLFQVLPSAAGARSAAQADGALRAARSALDAACAEVGQLAAQVAAQSAAPGGASGAAATTLNHETLPVTLIVTKAGVATQFGPALTFDPAGVGDCRQGVDPRAVLARQPVTPDGTTVVAVLPVGPALLSNLGQASSATVLIADSNSAAAAAARPGAGSHRSDDLEVRAVTLQRGASVLLVSVPRQVAAGFGLWLVLVVLVVILLAAAVAHWVSGIARRPLGELAAATARVAAGDFDSPVPVRGRDELANVARAFNQMASDLRAYVSALQDSRDEMGRNVVRLGEVLSSTHDLDRILDVIVDTASSLVRARGALLMLVSSDGTELYAAVARNVPDVIAGGVRPAAAGPLGRGPGRAATQPLPGLVLAPGRGLLGHVFESGVAQRLRLDGGIDNLAVQPLPEEPRATSVIAVPLRAGGKVLGALGLYDRRHESLGSGAFDDQDLVTLHTFAAQAGVAVDNVVLHQEAQRLSITDGLTGLWNYRYLSMALTREVERAIRFGRPLAVLMLDLDRFKSINDRYGHQWGDSVLIEVARRVAGEIREVDVLARYGGEEFACVLPETDLEGARSMAERIRRSIGQHHFPGGPSVIDPELPTSPSVTVSVGVAVYPHHGTTTANLLRAADAALYEAKRAGRDTVRVAANRPAVDPEGTERGTGAAGRAEPRPGLR